MRRDKGNNKESDENNKKTTQGRNTIRTMKSETPKLGNRPSTFVCNCRRMIHSVGRTAESKCMQTEREMDETTTRNRKTMKRLK